MDRAGLAGPPAGAGGAAAVACVTPPSASVLRRRFRNLVLPSLTVTALAWVALVLWGGGREMRRGLLTGGPALMSADSAGHGGTHAGHDAVRVAGGSAPMPDFSSAVPPPEPAHAVSMLGFDMGDLAPASPGHAGLFLWMWTVMVVAMMLPATLPSVRVFLAGDGNRRHCAGLSFLSGCLLTWVAAGVAVYGVLGVLDLALGDAAGRDSRFALGLGAVGLLAAAVFQFSRSKERVLAHVRGPFSCGDGPLRAGLHHGRRCLASCGPYMVAVALIGMMSIFWMAVFALVMLGEQLAEMRRGRGVVVARASGAVLVLVAGGLLLSPTPLPLVA